MTSDDLHSIRYFWEEKGDPTCWVGWEAAKPDLRKCYPEVFAAWEAHLETWAAHLEARRALSSALRDAIANSEEN